MKAEKPEPGWGDGGGIAGDPGSERQAITACEGSTDSHDAMTIEEVLRRENMLRAYQRVKRNKGSAGVDGMTAHSEPKLRVAPESVKRFRSKVRDVARQGRGRSLRWTIERLEPLIRGWVAYFRLAEVKAAFEQLDQWLRRRLRCILWRQWKRPRTRAKRLMKLGLDRHRAFTSASNGHGPWWNAGASHMNHAVPTRFFRQLLLLLVPGT